VKQAWRWAKHQGKRGDWNQKGKTAHNFFQGGGTNWELIMMTTVIGIREKTGKGRVLVREKKLNNGRPRRNARPLPGSKNYRGGDWVYQQNVPTRVRTGAKSGEVSRADLNGKSRAEAVRFNEVPPSDNARPGAQRELPWEEPSTVRSRIPSMKTGGVPWGGESPTRWSETHNEKNPPHALFEKGGCERAGKLRRSLRPEGSGGQGGVWKKAIPSKKKKLAYGRRGFLR